MVNPADSPGAFDAVPCHACGYDLRGVPAESDRCPECGEPIESSQIAWQREADDLGPIHALRRGARWHGLAHIPTLLTIGLVIAIELLPWSVRDGLPDWLNVVPVCLGFGLTGAMLATAAWWLRRGADGDGIPWVGPIATACFVIAVAGIVTAGVITQLVESMLFNDGLFTLFIALLYGAMFGATLGLILLAWAFAWRVRRAGVPKLLLGTHAIAVLMSLSGVIWVGWLTTTMYFELQSDSFFYMPPPWVHYLVGLAGIGLLVGLVLMLAQSIWLWTWTRRRARLALDAARAFTQRSAGGAAGPLGETAASA